MYVTTASAELHVHMEEVFGLPTVNDPTRPEIFGLYHVRGGPKYWAYDPTAKAWSVILGGLPENHDLVFGSWCDKNKVPEVREKMEALGLMDPPAFPDDVSIQVVEPPFVYEGWLFSWMFFPELKRWELAPLGSA